MSADSTFRGTLVSWAFRISWIAAASVGGALVVVSCAHVLSRSVVMLVAAAIAIAMHVWVVWYGVWRFDGGILGRLDSASRVLSLASGLLFLGGGFYLVFMVQWSDAWLLSVSLVFTWLFLLTLPSKFINVYAERAWMARHQMGYFCPKCNALMVGDSRSLGYRQETPPSTGGGIRTYQYGGRKCFVCGATG